MSPRAIAYTGFNSDGNFILHDLGQIFSGQSILIISFSWSFKDKFCDSLYGVVSETKCKWKFSWLKSVDTVYVLLVLFG